MYLYVTVLDLKLKSCQDCLSLPMLGLMARTPQPVHSYFFETGSLTQMGVGEGWWSAIFLFLPIPSHPITPSPLLQGLRL